MNYKKFDNTILHSLTNVSLLELALKSLGLWLFSIDKKTNFIDLSSFSKKNYQQK